jgi:hypothetical protein
LINTEEDYEHELMMSPVGNNNNVGINFDLKSNINENTIEDRVSVLDEISIQEYDQMEHKSKPIENSG